MLSFKAYVTLAMTVPMQVSISSSLIARLVMTSSRGRILATSICVVGIEKTVPRHRRASGVVECEGKARVAFSNESERRAASAGCFTMNTTELLRRRELSTLAGVTPVMLCDPKHIRYVGGGAHPNLGCK